MTHDTVPLASVHVFNVSPGACEGLFVNNTAPWPPARRPLLDSDKQKKFVTSIIIKLDNMYMGFKRLTRMSYNSPIFHATLQSTFVVILMFLAIINIIGNSTVTLKKITLLCFNEKLSSFTVSAWLTKLMGLKQLEIADSDCGGQRAKKAINEK